jgi:iron(III) transport system substrate-binding protein
VSARVNVVVYNTNQLKADQVPTSIMDLANPKWKGKLALAQGETDFQPIVTSIVATYGKQAALTWLKAIKANAGSNIYPDNESLVDQVNKGQAEIGISNSYYWYRLQDQVGSAGMHSAISYFAPGDAGYVVDVSGAAVLNSSKNKAAAQKFLAFMVSSKAQEIIAHDNSWEYPLGSGVTTARQQKPFIQLQPAPLTISQLGDGATAVALLQEVQLA